MIIILTGGSSIIPGHEVKSVYEKQWSDLFNGELLDQAVNARFNVLLTGDSHIKHQQNPGSRPIATVVLRASNNRLKTHIPMMPEVTELLATIKPGQLVEVPDKDLKGK